MFRALPLLLLGAVVFAQTEYGEDSLAQQPSRMVPLLGEAPGAVRFLLKGGATLDKVLDDAARSGRLFDVRYASLVTIPGGKAVYLPVVVGAKPGTVPRFDQLAVGREFLVGIFIQNNGIALEYLTRTAERSFRTRIVGLGGPLLYAGSGTLTVTNAKAGAGTIRFEPDHDAMAAGHALWPEDKRIRPFLAWGLIYYGSE